MRKWAVIGISSALILAAAGGGAYWLFNKTRIAGNERDARVVRIQSTDDGGAEQSDVIEPLVVQGRRNPPEVDPDDLVPRTELPVGRVVLEPGVQQPPRPDLVERMPMADEDPGIGGWFGVDWNALKARLSGLHIFDEIEKTQPAAEPENKDTSPPTELPPADPVPEYHQQEMHCPYHGPCRSPYRSLPRD